MKRCSTLLVIREMQINITVRYHYAPVGMITIKQEDTNSNGWRLGVLELSHTTDGFSEMMGLQLIKLLQTPLKESLF